MSMFYAVVVLTISAAISVYVFAKATGIIFRIMEDERKDDE